MNSTTKAPDKTSTQRGWVRINHWQNSRQIIVDEKNVILEVTLARCNHCSTCQGRVEGFRRTLAQKPRVVHAWIFMNGCTWLVVSKPKGKDPLIHLRKTLDLSSIENC